MKCEHFLRLAISGTNKRERAQVYAKSRAKDSNPYQLRRRLTPEKRELLLCRVYHSSNKEGQLDAVFAVSFMSESRPYLSALGYEMVYLA